MELAKNAGIRGARPWLPAFLLCDLRTCLASLNPCGSRSELSGMDHCLGGLLRVSHGTLTSCPGSTT